MNTHTEEEASKLLCPIQSDVCDGCSVPRYCIASECMMWIHLTETRCIKCSTEKLGHSLVCHDCNGRFAEVSVGRGYCGMARIR